MTTTEKISVPIKDMITYGGILLAFAANFFALSHKIDSTQLKHESNVREILMARENDTRIAELKEQQLKLEIERLKVELSEIKRQISTK